MKDWVNLEALDVARHGVWLLIPIAAFIACIYKPIEAFLSWIGIKDVRRRDIGVEPWIVPVGRPGPERSPGGPTETPSPSESPTPTAATPTPAPVPTGPAPTPSAAPSEAVPPSVAAPGKVAGNHAGTVKGRGCGRASNLRARCGEGVPLSVGYGGVIRHGSRSCCHGGSAGPGGSTAHSFATYSPGVAGWKLMPSGRCVAGAVTFPRPWTSAACTARGTGANARPRGRSPTAKSWSAPVIAATVAAPVVAAIGTASVETSTTTGARASATAAAVTTAMLSEDGRGEANKGEGYDS